MKTYSRAVLIAGIATVSIACKPNREPLSLEISPIEGESLVAYVLTNRSAVRIAVLDFNLPFATGQWTPDVFRFNEDDGSVEFLDKRIPHPEFDADTSLILLEPSEQFRVTINLEEHYRGELEGSSVYAEGSIQYKELLPDHSEVNEIDDLDSIAFLKSNTITLRNVGKQ